MQERRRSERPPAKAPSGEIIQVPGEHWEDLKRRDPVSLCENALTKTYPPEGILLPFLGEELLIDREHRRLCRMNQGRWERIEDPLLELLCLVYLLNVGPQPLSHEIISIHELGDAHFFQGPHVLKITPVVERYGNDLNGFRKAAERLGGEALNLADLAYRIPAFPKVPVYYLLWEGDEEFKPRLSILFDRSISHHLSADAIWGIVNLVSNALLLGESKQKMAQKRPILS
jgi:hypothetical protein